MTRRLVYVLVILLCTASVGIGVTAAHPHETAESPTAQPTTTQSTAQASSTDEIGCVDGICHDDDLEFEQPTNLSEAELDALVARTMARVEYLRDEPFSDEVPVEIQSRETFRESDVAEPPRDDEAFEQWNDQVWKGLFVVGDDERSADAIDATVGEAVNGFYMPNESRIVLVTESTDSPNVNELTLLHEFAHALQDQRHNLTGSQFSGETQDADLAVQGVVEGEAVYLEYQYEQRCASGEWSCFDEPNAPGDPSGDLNQGILFALLQPYSDGPAYVHDIVETEGWSGVDDRIQEPPETTREIIHRQSLKTGSAGSTGTDSVDTVESPPEPTEGWERYPDQGVSGAETVGEASLFVMLWYQASEYGADTVEPGHIHETTHEYERFNYVSDPSDGWAGDELIPYQRDDDDGYVWTIEWETSDDVDEFTRAYSAILDAHDATETEYGAYVISDGSFSGAYAVETDDTQVRIVHAPTEVGLFELDPSLDPTTVEQSPLEDDMPGFGVAAAVAALLTLAVASRRR